MSPARLVSCTLLFLLAATLGAASDQQSLNDASPFDRWSQGHSVFAVAVAPQELATPFFSAASLQQLLPDLYPARIRADWCQAKEKQRGVVVLSNGDIVFWHSCAPGLISFEGHQYPGTYGFKAE